MEESSAPATAPPMENFKHEPLDAGRRLIRIITVLPGLSKDGLVQCRLKHVALPPPRDFYEDKPDTGATDSSPSFNSYDVDEADLPAYTCLSYTWGEAHEEHSISINGQQCTIRKNLWDFLTMASENLAGQYFWIDALCIDQENTKERNHQVQQMGNIYTRAKAVIVWLGRDIGLELTLHAVNVATKARAMRLDHIASDSYSGPWQPRDGHISTYYGIEPHIAKVDVNDFIGSSAEERDNFFRDGTGKVEKLLENITTHVYWTRAWVTQEVLLSRNALVVAGSTVHSLTSLAIKFRTAVPYFRENSFENLIDIFIKKRQREVSLRHISVLEKLEFETWGLINLLHRFKNKNCAIRRDRIYSLLALCKEGTKLKVDYSVPDEQLMRQVLNLRESSMCFCSAGVVSNALSPWAFKTNDNEAKAETALGQQQEEECPFAQVHMYAYALTSAVCPFCSNWVPFSWTRKKGLVFCLGLACPDTQGHLFWEQAAIAPCLENDNNNVAQDTTTPTASDQQETASAASAVSTSSAEESTSIYAQSRQNNKSQFLCSSSSPSGIRITKSEWPHVYELQFTLRALVDMLQDDLTTGDLGLNACGNLWPNAESKAAVGLQRLQLCDV